MQTITFSRLKQKIAEFRADNLNFSRETDGLFISAEGEMLQQDTPLLEQIANHSATCIVTIVKDGETVIDQPFQVTFFTLEANIIVALLQ